MDELHRKKEKLNDILKRMGSVAVAFSAGVDSTFLLKAAHDALGDSAVAVTVRSHSFPDEESHEADAFCRREGIRHFVTDVDELSIDGFQENPPNRCYLCKRAIFGEIIRIAKQAGIDCVAEGSNTDDDADYRPGALAVAELGVHRPLRDAGLSKSDIRALSKELGLPTWDKPSMACLSTRFAYGEQITAEKLAAVGLAERRLHELGFRQVRVRVHGNLARIEVDPSAFEKITQPQTASQLNRYLQQLGFLYVTLDLGGYVTGSMNRMLEP